MSKSPAWVATVLIPITNARRQQNLRDSGARDVSDGIRSGRMGKDKAGRIRDSSAMFESYILSDPKPNVAVIVLKTGVLESARQSIPRGHSTRE